LQGEDQPLREDGYTRAAYGLPAQLPATADWQELPICIKRPQKTPSASEFVGSRPENVKTEIGIPHRSARPCDEVR